MTPRGLALLCPTLLYNTDEVFRSDVKVEGMGKGGLLLLCPLPPT